MNLNDRLIASPLPGRPFLAATAVLTAAALVMTQLPLVGDLGFEFAVLTAFIAAFATGFMTIHLVAAWRRSHGKETTLSTLLAPLFGFSLATLFLPLDVMFIKSWISGFCNVSEGLAFYLLLPGITVLWSTSVATLCALATERKLRATLLFIAVMFASIGISVYRLATQPPVFAYNPIIGYFPGPIYDEVVVISSTLLAARGIVLVSVLAMVAGPVRLFRPCGQEDPTLAVPGVARVEVGQRSDRDARSFLGGRGRSGGGLCLPRAARHRHRPGTHPADPRRPRADSPLRHLLRSERRYRAEHRAHRRGTRVSTVRHR